MNNVTRRETITRIAYDFIKEHGPVPTSEICRELNRYYKNGVYAREVGRYLSMMRGHGLIRIVNEYDSKTHNRVWDVVE